MINAVHFYLRISSLESWNGQMEKTRGAQRMFHLTSTTPTAQSRGVSFYQIEIRSASWPQETDGGGAEPMLFRALQTSERLTEILLTGHSPIHFR
jgi:hypothetical protein